MRRTLRNVALLALLPAAWLASHRDMVHRSVIDPREPLYTSNYLDARGLGFPWLVTEVPPDLGSVPWRQRVYPLNLAFLYGAAFVFVSMCWLVAFAVRASWRALRRAST